MTPPVTSTCFVNLALTLLPWGLSTEMWCVDVPAPVASTAGACKSQLYISYYIQLVHKVRCVCVCGDSVRLKAEHAFN